MTEDEMNPNICPSALEEDGTLDRSKWDGAHKWDEETGECNECGTQGVHPKHICECGNEHEDESNWVAA